MLYIKYTILFLVVYNGLLQVPTFINQYYKGVKESFLNIGNHLSKRSRVKK